MRPKLFLVGLGNPGKKYAFTRHNAGKMFAAYLAQHAVEGITAIESEEYMNNSGRFVAGLVQKTLKTRQAGGSRPEADEPLAQDIPPSDSPTVRSSDAPRIPSFPNLIIAHDDLDLPLGGVKLQFGKGPLVHRGVASVEAALGTTEFWRLRLGIDNRQPEIRDKYIGKDYVLSVFTRAERKILVQGFEDAKMVIQKNLQF